jgi:hypothetical protein
MYSDNKIVQIYILFNKPKKIIFNLYLKLQGVSTITLKHHKHKILIN